MKKFAILLIILGVLVVAGVSLGVFSYTDYIFEHVATGEPVEPDWRPGEIPLHLDTVRIIASIGGAVSLLGLILFLVGHAKEIRKQDIIGILFVVLGSLTMLGFLTGMFYPCYHTMPAAPRPMRCIFTMRVLSGVASMIGISGVLMLVFRKVKAIALGLNMAVVLAGIVFLLIPTVATGVCVVHRCVDGFLPFSIIMGGVMTAVSLVSVFVLAKQEADEDEEDAETSHNI
ncbi:MAG: DUF4418 family protein [Oscillospiraceae bacterium]|nr:DUF4418 family protein [Oscillospiraceae bacterium]